MSKAFVFCSNCHHSFVPSDSHHSFAKDYLVLPEILKRESSGRFKTRPVLNKFQDPCKNFSGFSFRIVLGIFMVTSGWGLIKPFCVYDLLYTQSNASSRGGLEVALKIDNFLLTASVGLNTIQSKYGVSIVQSQKACSNSNSRMPGS